MSVISKLLDLFYPPKCILCGKLLDKDEQDLCCSCNKRAFDTNPHWEKGKWYTAAMTPLTYEGAVRSSIRRYKFNGASWYSEVYGRILADCIQKHMSLDWDVLTWVPVSRSRMRERGYDQAYLLALEAGIALGTTPVSTLSKVINTGKQSKTVNAENRKVNAAGAYEVNNPEVVIGKRILLIDDILTTGSTMEECSRMLLNAGAESVICAALAWTP